MITVFYWLLNMSITGGIVCLVVLGLRCIKALPRRFVYALWLIPLLRLLLPFGVSTPWSVMNLLERLGTREVRIVTQEEAAVRETAAITDSDSIPDDAEEDAAVQSGDDYYVVWGAGVIPDGWTVTTQMNHIRAADSYSPLTFGAEEGSTAIPSTAEEFEIDKELSEYVICGQTTTAETTNVLENVFRTSSAIWFVVALACSLAASALYWLTLSEIRRSSRKNGDVWVCDRVTTPALYGILRPRIVVPPDTPEQSLRYIQLHEQRHKHRLDNLWRCVAVGVCCLHWFNPLCWLSLKYFFVDMELSCDEAVVRGMSKRERKRYATALLSFATGKNLFSSAFGGVGVRVRITRVLNYRRLSFAATAALVVLFATIVSALITN